MSVAVFSLFRFSGIQKGWAFFQMPLQPLFLRREKDLQFFKLMGCGRGAVFSNSPDWSRYAFLAVFENYERAENFYRNSRFYKKYSSKCAESWTGFISPVKSYGKWDGKEPFKVKKGCKEGGPLVVLTRATINRSAVRGFRKHAIHSTKEAAGSEGLLCSVGMGEDPWYRQATLSIWKDAKSMRRYAYGSPRHQEVMKKTRQEKWYSEELFARFTLLSCEGTWNGEYPVKGMKNINL